MGRKLRGRISAALIVAASLAIPASATAGDSLAVQPDGKIVLAGESLVRGLWPEGAMVRFEPDGSLDRSFGSDGGLVDLRTGTGYGPVAVRADGRIVAVTGVPAQPSAGPEGFRLWALDPDGAPEPSFGDAGFAAAPSLEPGWTSSPTALAARPNGQLALGGSADAFLPATGFSMGGALLINRDGSFAEAIGRLDEPDTDLSEWRTLSDLLERPDGSIIALGLSRLGAGNLLLGRFLPGSGSRFDPSFAAGKGLTLFNPNPEVGAVYRANAVVSSGDRLIVVGTYFLRLLLVGFDRNGVLDTSFAENGFTLQRPENSAFAEASDAVVQPDGKIVAAGMAREPCPAQATGCWSVVVARFGPDGSLDKSFGSEGFVRVPSSDEGAPSPRPIDVALAPGGGILVADTSGLTLRVVKLMANGAPDTGFGSGGTASAEPCASGRVADLRRIGCFSSVRVKLGTNGLRHSRHPKIQVRASASQPLDPLARVSLQLPHQLAGKPEALARRAKVTGSGDEPVTASSRRRIAVATDAFPAPTTISLALPPGVVRRVGHVRRGRKLAFRVRVWFQDGSRQTIVLRRAG